MDGKMVYWIAGGIGVVFLLYLMSNYNTAATQVKLAQTEAGVQTSAISSITSVTDNLINALAE